MDQFLIEGGHSLAGEVTPGGNRNAAFPLLAACLLTDEPLTLHNLPACGDVAAFIRLVSAFGVEVLKRDSRSITLQARKITSDPGVAMSPYRIRGGPSMIGPALARCGECVLSLADVDRSVKRRADMHIMALQALGADVDQDGRVRVRSGGLHAADILLPEASVTTTESLIMAAALTDGTSTIQNAACEPHVQDLCHCINLMGGQVSGIGSNVLVVQGVPRLRGGEFTLSSDHIEIGSLIGLGAVTKGEIRIRGVNRQHLRMVDSVFQGCLGVRMHYEGDTLVVEDDQDLVIRDDLGGAVPKIENAPWPGFPADLLSVALVVATQANGSVLIHDKMFDNRLFFVDRLIGMGAQVILCDPHRAVVVGPSRLHGSRLASPDIRAGMALVIATLCATGVSEIDNVEQIDQGFERLEDKLRGLGAHIERRLLSV